MKKIFKLWVELAEKDKLRDSSNLGLNKFLQNNFNTTYEGINNSFSYNNTIKDKIIEALKSWKNR